MDKDILRSYSCVMRHGRLNSWASKVLAENPDIIITDADINFNNSMTFTFSNSDKEYEAYHQDEEFYMFNLQMCAKISTNGFYFLIFKLPNLRNEHVDMMITIDIFKDHCEELTELCEACIKKNLSLSQLLI